MPESDRDQGRPASGDGRTDRTPFGGRLVILGFGAIGQAVLPLLCRHLDMPPARIEVVQPSPDGRAIAERYGVRYAELALDRDNHRELLGERLGRGDLLLNLSLDVGSVALMAWCQQLGVLYVDACTEPWPGVHDDPARPLAQRTNYARREEVLSLARSATADTTALVTLGANPGLVSFLAKQALLELAGERGAAPHSREEWAQLARRLDVRAIHVSERDTQVAQRRRQRNEFVNTWSVQGFVGEGLQPAELGWGTHEHLFPTDAARHPRGCRAAVYLDRPGLSTRVRSWAPRAGAFSGYLVTHAESISIADHLTVGDPARPDYRPTVHYAYHPCDDAVLSIRELEGRRWRLQPGHRLLRDDIVSGADELGVLLMSGTHGAFWYGSTLSIDEARALVPENNATTLQVAAPLVAGVRWAIAHPDAGVLEPDDLPHDEMLQACRPWLGEVGGVRSDWTPLEGADRLFDEGLDFSDPWQFSNVRVR
jgi:homospermidine synthase